MTPFTTFTLILIVIVLLLVAEIEHRAVVAILAAVLSTYFGISYGLFKPADVVEMMNVDTVLFITGVLILFESISRSGFFDFVGLSLARLIGPRPRALIYALIALTTLFSGISSNVTVMLVMGNITLRLAALVGVEAEELVILECLQTNVGGLLLPLSSVPALIISAKTGLGFADFLRVTGPLILLLTAVAMLYSRRIGSLREARSTAWKDSLKARAVSRTALYRSTLIFATFLAAASMSDLIGLNLTLITFIFVTATFLLSSLDPDEVFRSVDWGIPFFVGGFFVFVGGLERSGVLDAVSSAIAPLLEMPEVLAAPLLLLMCALISAFIDNIPVVLLLYPIVKGVAEATGLRALPLYWAMIIGSNLGGNLTPFASPSVLIGVRFLERRGMRVTMGEFFRKGVPLAITQILLSMAYVASLTALNIL
ncbi:MAG: hypothetical protein DRK00_01230 [Thermoprotei archaeon]|nr:MAG: hypothetical protein DRK00_01230 [Thermoprotei archaeon]